MKIKTGALLLGAAIAGLASTAGQAGENSFSTRPYFTTTITSKVFTVSGSTTPCPTTTETHTLVHDGTTTTDTVQGTNGATVCFHQIETSISDNLGSRGTRTEFYDPANTTVLTSTEVFDKGILSLPSRLHKDMSWALETGIVRTLASGVTQQGHFIGHYSFIGFEDVTVPAGSFQRCLKITRFSYFALPVGINFSAPSNFRVEWRCPGVGLVKRLDHNGRKFELTSFTQ